VFKIKLLLNLDSNLSLNLITIDFYFITLNCIIISVYLA